MRLESLLEWLEKNQPDVLAIQETKAADPVFPAAAIQDAGGTDEHPAYPLLFDPQTSGGLLAAVPEDRYEQCLSALHEMGCDQAVRIGIVSDRLEGDVLIVLV